MECMATPPIINNDGLYVYADSKGTAKAGISTDESSRHKNNDYCKFVL